MADAQRQLTELDGMFDGFDELEALDMDFETVEAYPTPEVGMNEISEADRSEMAHEEASVIEEELTEDLTELIAEGEEEALEIIERQALSEERQKRLDGATLSKEKMASAKALTTTEKGTILESNRNKPRVASDAIDVARVINEKVKPTIDHWVFFDGIDGKTTRDDILPECTTLPRKIRDKVVNLMDWHVRGKKLSVYTRIGLELLLENRKISAASLRNRYMSNPGKPYSLGTSNAQAAQTMQLFRTFRIINSAGDAAPDHRMLRNFEPHHGI